MLPIERRAEIIRLIRRDGSVKVGDLSTLFSVTEETIRRDLDKLGKEGQVKKTYGGAVLNDNLSEDLSYIDREKANIIEKRKIAEVANGLIKDGDTIFIDASTTALEVAKSIESSKEVTIITNSVYAIGQLSNYDNLKMIGIGGSLNEKTLAMEGPMATKFIDYYYADKVFFSVKGINKQKGVMDPREVTADIKKHMIDNSRQSILVVDQTKFEQSAMVKTVEIGNIDIIITEYELDNKWVDYLSKNNIEVMVAK
ncbi:MAG: DeoR/GlpR family DNA-binding transcription regulator [Eubacteriales bacterium]